jgi:hypothetical protein
MNHPPKVIIFSIMQPLSAGVLFLVFQFYLFFQFHQKKNLVGKWHACELKMLKYVIKSKKKKKRKIFRHSHIFNWHPHTHSTSHQMVTFNCYIDWSYIVSTQFFIFNNNNHIWFSTAFAINFHMEHCSLGSVCVCVCIGDGFPFNLLWIFKRNTARLISFSSFSFMNEGFDVQQHSKI